MVEQLEKLYNSLAGFIVGIDSFTGFPAVSTLDLDPTPTRTANVSPTRERNCVTYSRTWRART
jgi:hypothetical protein